MHIRIRAVDERPYLLFEGDPMPGSIRKSGSKYIVYWGGKKKGTHESKAKAERQMRALQASKKKGE